MCNKIVTNSLFIAPAGSVLFFIALIAMFLERERHGQVRGLLGAGAAFFAVVALF